MEFRDLELTLSCGGFLVSYGYLFLRSTYGGGYQEVHWSDDGE